MGMQLAGSPGFLLLAGEPRATEATACPPPRPHAAHPLLALRPAAAPEPPAQLPSCPCRLNPSHSRKALRNSRIVSQKDDVHVCIMCLRAIMNYQVGAGSVLQDPWGTPRSLQSLRCPHQGQSLALGCGEEHTSAAPQL